MIWCQGQLNTGRSAPRTTCGAVVVLAFVMSAGLGCVRMTLWVSGDGSPAPPSQSDGPVSGALDWGGLDSRTSPDARTSDVSSSQADAGPLDSSRTRATEWVVGDKARSCHEACLSRGMVCEPDLLRDHDSEVDSEAEVKALFAAGGVKCTSYGIGGCTPCGGDSRVPYATDSGYCAYSHGRLDGSFSCGSPSIGTMRLCFCIQP